LLPLYFYKLVPDANPIPLNRTMFNKKILKKVISENRVDDINARFMEAVYYGKADLVKKLLEAGANINIRNKTGDTALMMASVRSHDHVVKILLESEADVNVKNEHGLTALSLAQWCKHAEIIKMLKEAGAVQEPQSEITLELFGMNIEDYLRKASQFKPTESDRTEQEEKQIRKYPRIFRSIQTRRILNEGLLNAAENGDTTKIKSLAASGVKINKVTNKNLCTSLMLAAANGRNDAVELLIILGADLNAKDKSGRTALIWAASSGHAEPVKTLLKFGADGKVKDSSGNTALSWAKAFNHEEIIKIL
jgi:uncharacterized protein